MSDRFIGEANITFSDGSSERRRVVVLSPYVQTSEDIKDIDYNHSLVVDIQTMEFDFKVQVEEMLNNQELRNYKTFIEYAHKIAFRNGENVLAWLHRMAQIKRVPASEVFLIYGQGGNTQKINVAAVNDEIRKTNEEIIARRQSSTVTDPSMQESYEVAKIEKSGNQYKPPVTNEAPEPSMEPAELDLSKIPGVTILEGASTWGTDTDSGGVEVDNTPPSTPSQPALSSDVVEGLTQQVKELEVLIKKRTKDTFVTRLMEKYNLTEVEVTKAIESAGLRKQKKEAKAAESDSSK